ncbi:hypothetical protein BABINDRAFT_9358 [Babjeviella inositovora NRRL Y-12698]|uniref:Uncharacterized protein n=1 Tax=Babjeviella inositovora NRRL Y-12698 TaxID=984486 RepID=A0A1E3QNN3_9ASCO|nr:uncharacterized protein BABINDRAFT_9358 [Babjeviella inositovora NRRL Y-12698]ODQ78597.1 hypothetical protein BABINDRAFT_9358 [Babjeviella inositovora NRRL Y-12698]
MSEEAVSQTDAQPVQFRIIVGSYEHNVLCLSLILNGQTPVFQPIFHFQAHTLSIQAMDIARRYLVTGSNDEQIKIYDLQKRKELGTLLEHVGSVTSLTFSNEGATLDEANKNQVINSTSGKTGKWLLSGSADGKIVIWRTKDWEVFGQLKGHKERINDIAIHPSGRVAISVSDDKTIRLWNLMTAKKAAVLKMKGRDTLGESGQYVKWSLDGKHFLVGLVNKILLYTTATAKIAKKIKFTQKIMHFDTYKIDDTEYVVVGLGNGALEFYKIENLLRDAEDEEQEEEDIDTVSFEPEFTLLGHTNRIKNFSIIYFKLSGKQFLTSVSSDGKIVVWDLALRDQVAVYDTGERLTTVSLAPESVERFDTMKRRLEEAADIDDDSENETDGEELKKMIKNKKKKTKKAKKTQVSVLLE